MAGAPKVELFYSGAWNDITSKVYDRDAIRITRGKPDEGGTVQPTKCLMTLNNRDGRFSPRNPTGALYGLIGRNTKVRVSYPSVEPFIEMAYTALSYIDTPDSAALSITGDIDVRVDITLTDWTGAVVGNQNDLAGKWGAAGQRSWRVMVFNTKALMQWSPDGTTILQATSTVKVPTPWTGRKTVRFTLDVNNGAAGNTVTFYVGDSVNTTEWVQLGDPVTAAGVTSIFDSTQVLCAGVGNNASAAKEGRLHALQVRNGINGTIVANPYIGEEAVGATSFADSVPITWTLRSSAAITNYVGRFFGEVTAWPQRWDPTGRDVFVPLEASGITRRLGQGAAPVASTLRRGIGETSPVPKAYWPCEEGERAALFASGLAGFPPMRWGATTPGLAANTAFAASNPIPTVGTSSWSGQVPSYTSTGTVVARFLLAVPATGTTNNAVLFRMLTGGTVNQWDVVYTTGGNLALKGFTDDGATKFDTGAVAFAVDGKLLRVSVEAIQNGANIDYALTTLIPGAATGSTITGTEAADTVTKALSVKVNPGKDDLGETAIGHVTVEDNFSSLFLLGDQLNAYDGERAGARMARLANEADLSVSPFGDITIYLTETARMGQQKPDTVLNLLREAEATDGGILHESRTSLNLIYRPRDEIVAQRPVARLDYHGDLSGLEPTEDDQATRNDVTVTRKDGGSSRQVLTSGAMSTAAPPSGVGTYDDSVTLSLYLDSDAPDQAGWRLHLGTVDEQRFPNVTIHLARSAFTGDPLTGGKATMLDVGDRFIIENPPSWLPQVDIELLVLGYTEILTKFEHVITYNCAPARPWDVAVYNDNLARYSSDGSTLAAAVVTTSATSLSVATVTGPLWSHADGDFDIIVGGEVMTVTAVAGTTSPQTFTVTRSVNGVVKTHLINTAVELARPCYWSL